MPGRDRRLRRVTCAVATAAALAVAGCNGLYLGDNPRPDVRKELGPLTVPPPPAADPPKR